MASVKNMNLPEFSVQPDSTDSVELDLRPKMFLLDKSYEPLVDDDSDVQDTDDKDGSVFSDDFTQPDTTTMLTGSVSSNTIPNESSSPPSVTSTTSDIYDSEEETEPLNFTDRKSDTGESPSDESSFETGDLTVTPTHSGFEYTSVGTNTDVDIDKIPGFVVGETLEETEQEANKLWEREHADELGKVEAVLRDSNYYKIERHVGEESVEQKSKVLPNGRFKWAKYLTRCRHENSSEEQNIRPSSFELNLNSNNVSEGYNKKVIGKPAFKKVLVKNNIDDVLLFSIQQDVYSQHRSEIFNAVPDQRFAKYQSVAVS